MKGHGQYVIAAAFDYFQPEMVVGCGRGENDGTGGSLRAEKAECLAPIAVWLLAVANDHARRIVLQRPERAGRIRGKLQVPAGALSNGCKRYAIGCAGKDAQNPYARFRFAQQL